MQLMRSLNNRGRYKYMYRPFYYACNFNPLLISQPTYIECSESMS